MSSALTCQPEDRRHGARCLAQELTDLALTCLQFQVPPPINLSLAGVRGPASVRTGGRRRRRKPRV